MAPRTPRTPRATHHAPRTTHHALRITRHAPRTTHTQRYLLITPIPQVAALELASGRGAARGGTKPATMAHSLQHAPPLVNGRVDWREYEEAALTKVHTYPYPYPHP